MNIKKRRKKLFKNSDLDTKFILLYVFSIPVTINLITIMAFYTEHNLYHS